MAHCRATGISAGTERRWGELLTWRGQAMFRPQRWCAEPAPPTASSANTTPFRAMERTGIEPVTSGLQSRRSPS